MKKLTVFTIAFVTSIYQTLACGFSPYGEDIRFSFLSTKYFNYDKFSMFDYNANSFGYNYTYLNQYESNVYDWYNYVSRKVNIDEINQCINKLTLTDFQINSDNLFVQYLYKNKMHAAIDYLLMAKKCEDLNSFYSDDPWERNDSIQNKYPALINELNLKLNQEKQNYFQRKYAFLLIRLAYYSKDYSTIHSTFDAYFKTSTKDYLYYWALYFDLFTRKNIQNDLTEIVLHSDEKRLAAFYYFKDKFNFKSALKEAKSDEEISAVYAFASLQKLDPNLDYLQQIYKHTSHSKILDFLLLRELNKIEDWVYTPYYTNFLPSIQFVNSYYTSNDLQTVQILRSRSENDRLYADKVLQFVQQADLSKIDNQMLWKSIEIQLLFITRKWDDLFAKINAFQQQFSNEKVIEEIDKIKALAIIAQSSNSNAILDKTAEDIVSKYLYDAHFIFALGREMEFKGNHSDALAFIAYGNKHSFFTSNSLFPSSLSWRDHYNQNSGNLIYFFDYFDYIDFVYSADDLNNIIQQIQREPSDEFHQIIFIQINKDLNYLKDLLGTKYIRENNINKAYDVFKNINQKYWDENYNAWERDRYDERYSFLLNPFYDLKYTENFIDKKESFIVSKLSVTEHLIKYLSLANNPQTLNRSYYYFLVANCYLGMSQYGDAWMMRRFKSSTPYENNYKDSYIDELEFRNANLAQEYYHLAYTNSDTPKFKALCLRMEEYAGHNIQSNYKKLKKEFPEYYSELSNCENLKSYFYSTN